MNMKNVTILDHPLIQHKISLLRNKNTGTNEFRSLTDEIAMLMGYEALRANKLFSLSILRCSAVKWQYRRIGTTIAHESVPS